MVIKMKSTNEKQGHDNQINYPDEKNATSSLLDNQKNSGISDQESSTSVEASPPKTSKLAIASMILGILGILMWTFTFFIPCILAIITGHIACSEIKKSKGAITGNGMAFAGLIMGYLVPTSILVGPMIMKNMMSDSQIKNAKLQIEDFITALDAFRLDMKRYPSTSEGLQALIVQPPDATGWSGPYLRKDTISKDPWGNEYQYRSPGYHGTFDLYSLGADNTEGGEGMNQDIVSWQ